MRVIVAGAGFAGLAAADELQRRDISVTVLEARDRLGGRVWSVPFAGGVAERGAEFVLPGYPVMGSLAERFGLRLVRKGTLYGRREARGGPRQLGTEEIEDGATRLATAASSRDGTVADVLDRVGLEPAVAEAIRARVEISCAHPAGDLESGMLASGATAYGDFESHTIEGGNDVLARALAASLGDAVRLGSPVRRVRWSAREVEVDGRVADALVLTVPASVIGAIEFEPALPEAKRAALSGVVYGQAAKLFVGLRAPAAPSAVMSVPGRYWCWTQFGNEGEGAPFLAAFAGTLAALDALEVHRGPEKWLASLAELRPDLEFDLDAVLLSTWHDDPWVRGAYSARSARSPLLTDELARPVGPLVFAGEHTAGEWHGLMEGALRSGLRAAKEIARSP